MSEQESPARRRPFLLVMCGACLVGGVYYGISSSGGDQEEIVLKVFATAGWATVWFLLWFYSNGSRSA